MLNYATSFIVLVFLQISQYRTIRGTSIALLCDLSIVDACVYLFTECVTKSCDPPDRLVQTCYQSASSRVTETTFLTQKCFSVENFIIVHYIL